MGRVKLIFCCWIILTISPQVYKKLLTKEIKIAIIIGV